MRALGLAFVLTLIGTAPVLAQTEPPTAVVLVNINSDMSVDIDGKRYVGDVAIKAKLEELRDRKPAPELHWHAEKSASYQTVAHLLTIARDVGGLNLGFVGIDSGN